MQTTLTPTEMLVLDDELKLRIPSTLKKALKLKAVQEDTEMSDVVRRLIEQYVHGVDSIIQDDLASQLKILAEYVLHFLDNRGTVTGLEMSARYSLQLHEKVSSSTVRDDTVERLRRFEHVFHAARPYLNVTYRELIDLAHDLDKAEAPLTPHLADIEILLDAVAKAYEVMYGDYSGLNWIDPKSED